MFGNTLTIHTLVAQLMQRSADELSWDELEALQHYVNKGKTGLLLGEYPDLEAILTVHANDGTRSAKEVKDIVLQFLLNGGQMGSSMFRDLIVKMVKKNWLKTTAVQAMENADFIPVGGLQTVRDGVVVDG